MSSADYSNLSNSIESLQFQLTVWQDAKGLSEGRKKTLQGRVESLAKDIESNRSIPAAARSKLEAEVRKIVSELSTGEGILGVSNRLEEIADTINKLQSPIQDDSGQKRLRLRASAGKDVDSNLLFRPLEGTRVVEDLRPESFVKEIRAQFKDNPDEAARKVLDFFQQAARTNRSAELQTAFFSCLTPGDEKLLYKIFDAVIPSISHLDLGGCGAVLKDKHLDYLFNKFNDYEKRIRSNNKIFTISVTDSNTSLERHSLLEVIRSQRTLTQERLKDNL